MTNERLDQLPLVGVRVLDLSTGVAGSATRLLAELGADVIKVQQPGATVYDDESTDAAAITAFVRDSSKRGILLDLEERTADLALFWQLAATCDLVVEDSTPVDHAKRAVTPRSLRERLPLLVVVSVTPFGQSGPYRDWVATDAVLSAMSGVLSRSGLPGREPLLPPGGIASEAAAAQVAWAALVAYQHRLATGRGEHVDVSLFETVAQTLDPGWGIGGSATGGVPAADGPRDRPDARHLYPVFSCADGFVRICMLAPRQWQGMFRWLGEPEELSDPALNALARRFSAAGVIYPSIQRLFAGLTRAEIVAASRDHGVPAAAVLNPAEMREVDQFTERGAFVKLPTTSRDLVVPNGVAVIDGARAGVRGAAPGPDQDRAAILAELDRPSSDATIERNDLPALPLAGVRVLDLGVIVVGAEAGRLLADLGAEVIKVENSAFPDGSRQSLIGEAMTASFAWGHRNKTSLGLNLRSPEGIAVFKELVARADVVLSNFKPGTMESLGLDYEVLAEVNPRLVWADSSAYGSTGPWSRRMGYGPLVRAEAGLTSLWRYPDTADSFSDASTIYPDHSAARVIATSVLALLLRRHETGRGGQVSVAQAEVILAQLGPQLAQESVLPGGLHAVGSRLPGDAGRGVFPCAGEDEWVVIDVRGDEDFQRLARATGHREWCADTRFSSARGREENREGIEAALAAWTRTWTPRQAAGLLQAAGVPAGMMLRVVDLLQDPHLVERRFFRTMTHPLVSREMPAENHPAVFSSIPESPLRPAPLAGEHSRDVLMQVLDYSADHVAALVANGVVEEPTQLAGAAS